MSRREDRLLHDYFAAEVADVDVPPAPPVQDPSMIFERRAARGRFVRALAAVACMIAVPPTFLISLRAPVPLEELAGRIRDEHAYERALPSRETVHSYVQQFVERRQTP